MIVRLLLITTTILCLFGRDEAICNSVGTLIACRRTLPTSNELKNKGQSVDVFIQTYKGNLTLDGLIDGEQHSVNSVQIQRSTIDWIQPSYFARLSGGKLKKLVLTSVNGTLNLDYSTLTGLEDTLQVLRVSDYHIGSTDYLQAMTSLETLQLARTGLSKPPENFPLLMSHLTNVDLSFNHLDSMPWNMVIERAAATQFQDIRLNGNNWVCSCDMKPIVEAPIEIKRKIIDLKCSYPGELSKLTVTSLTLRDVCPDESQYSKTKQDLDTPPKQESGPGGAESGDSAIRQQSDGHVNDAFGQDNEAQVATAGSVSTEVIAIIVAVILVVLIVLISVIVFKVRARNQQRRRQQGSPKKPSHKSKDYCHVIEHPASKPVANTKNSTNITAAAAAASGGQSPASGTSNYGRDFESNERQPLAPSYYAQQDNRL